MLPPESAAGSAAGTGGSTVDGSAQAKAGEGPGVGEEGEGSRRTDAMRIEAKVAGALLLAAAVCTAGAQERVLTYWDEEVPLEDVLYPAGVGEAEAEEAGIRLDPPALVQRSYDTVKVIWWVRYRAPDPDGLDEVRKAWEASLPEGVEVEIAVNPWPTSGKGFEQPGNKLQADDQKLLSTLDALGHGRRGHEALVGHFADPPKRKGRWRRWEPTERQGKAWGGEGRERFARQMGVPIWIYREEERKRQVRWERWLTQQITASLELLTLESRKLEDRGRAARGWTPRILVQGRWMATPNLGGGLRGTLRGANAAIAREKKRKGGGPGVPRSTEEMRRWLAGAHGAVLGLGDKGIVWNEEAEEVWGLGENMEVERVWRRSRDGKWWTRKGKKGGTLVMQLWPRAAQLKARPDGRRHPAMAVAGEVRGKGIRVRWRGSEVRLGPGNRATDESGREGTWRLEGGELRFRIGEREGAVGWRKAAREVGYRIPRGKDWRRKSPWHRWTERERTEEEGGHHSGAP